MRYTFFSESILQGESKTTRNFEKLTNLIALSVMEISLLTLGQIPLSYEKVTHTREKIFQSPERIARARELKSSLLGYISWKLARNLLTKSLTESERSARFQPGIILKIIE